MSVCQFDMTSILKYLRDVRGSRVFQDCCASRASTASEPSVVKSYAARPIVFGFRMETQGFFEIRVRDSCDAAAYAHARVHVSSGTNSQKSEYSGLI